jgi:hypothetical protein
MPPYAPYASRAQQRLLHAKATKGEISPKEIAGKDKATDFSTLQERVKVKKTAHVSRKSLTSRSPRQR